MPSVAVGRKDAKPIEITTNPIAEINNPFLNTLDKPNMKVPIEKDVRLTFNPY